MNDARQAFHDLQQLAGSGFAHSDMAQDPDRVERKVGRRRAARTSALSLGVIAVVSVGAVGINTWRTPEPLPVLGPATSITSSIPPAPEPSGDDTSESQKDDAPVECQAAEVVSGKPVGNLGGMEGWFNSMPSAPCHEWDQRVLDHPATVLIHTSDSTVVEAYYRTTIETLGPYADLGPDFVVPDPDPDWPGDSLVLIDARTGELLEEFDLTEIADAIAGNFD